MQVWATRAGPPGVLEARDEQAAPPSADADLADRHVRIDVAYAGVNFADLAARVGTYQSAPRFPFVPGFEVSGRVAASADPQLTPGTRVVAFTRFGGYSDAVTLPAEQVMALPDAVSLQAAAALPVAYLTAYQGLVVMGSVRPESRVLVIGAGGGLGMAAVQVCRHLGATVLAAASSNKHQHLIDSGVRHVIDYRDASLATAVATITNDEGVDVVLEPRGAAACHESYAMLAPGGRLVICGNAAAVPAATPRPMAALLANLRFATTSFSALRLARDNRAVMGIHLGELWHAVSRVRGWFDTLVRWTAEGALAPHIDKVFPLAQAADAHARLHARRNIGKVLLAPNPDR